jgi:predicted nuclease with RNAse H fold
VALPPSRCRQETVHILVFIFTIAPLEKGAVLFPTTAVLKISLLLCLFTPGIKVDKYWINRLHGNQFCSKLVIVSSDLTASFSTGMHMLFSPMTFVGVDPTAGRHPFTYAALDQNCELIAMDAGEIDEVLAFLTGQQAVLVAVNAPPHPNKGLVRSRLEQQSLSLGHLRGSDMRQAEYELRECGISVSPTPSRPEACSAWMQMGFDFYRRLESAGFKQYPADEASHRWLETHPHAAFCALLGQLPLPKPTLEGRLQRQIALYEQGVGIKDPMEFFEEITRHKLLRGILPMDLIYASEELDTIIAAYVAYSAYCHPQNMKFIGDAQEGQLALPVADLKERYN